MATQRSFFIIMMCVMSMSCEQAKVADTSLQKPYSQQGTSMSNPVAYFEIPVIDMDRAITFYETLLAIKLERQVVDGYEMALFPFSENAPGASGALAKGDVYVPSKTGAIIYLRVDSIDATLIKAQALNATVLYPKKDIGEAGWVAEIEDSEGNRLALLQQK